MAGTSGLSSHDLTSPAAPAGDPLLLEAVEKAPWHFGFLGLLRRIEATFPDTPRFGETVHTAEEPIRFGQEPSLAFAPSTLAKFVRGRDGRPPRLSVYFLGLLGPNGPLPLHLSEYIRARVRNENDETFARFLDIFHHRMLSLFYRAWAQARPEVSMDQPDRDRFGAYVGSLIGIGQETLRDRDLLPDFVKLFFAGRLSAQTRNPEGLAAMVTSFLGIDAKVKEFVGQWLKLPFDALCRIGGTSETATLGVTALVGSRIWDCRQKIRIVLGPLRLEEFERLLPNGNGSSLERLTALVTNYVGYELAFDVQLVLRKEEVPPLKLGGDARLGFSTWTFSRSPEQDFTDLVLDVLGDGALSMARRT